MCKYGSEYFRSVQVEHDYEEGVVPFELYETCDFPSSTTRRSRPLSVRDAYSEAGIEMIFAKKKPESIPHPKGIP